MPDGGRRPAGGSAGELAGDLRHMLALEARNGQFLLRWLTRAVAARDGRGAIRRATVGLGDVEELADTVAGRHDDHAVVRQGGPGGGDGHFLPATGARGGEYARDLAMQCALGPQAAGAVEEVAHLSDMLPKRVGVPKMIAS